MQPWFIGLRNSLVTKCLAESCLKICEEVSLGIDQGGVPWSIPKEASSQIINQDSKISSLITRILTLISLWSIE